MCAVGICLCLSFVRRIVLIAASEFRNAAEASHPTLIVRGDDDDDDDDERRS